MLRFAVVKALAAHGVPVALLETEWRRPGVPDAVDLVVNTTPRVAVEFKYPREPRATNAPWTQHLGGMLRDFFRLAYMPADFGDRWCVQLLSVRMQQYLTGVADRSSVRLATTPGETSMLPMPAVRALPATATRPLARWLATEESIVARCVQSYPVGDLSLIVHEVHPVTAMPD